MSNKLVKNNDVKATEQEANAPVQEKPEPKPAPAPEKKPGLFKRIKNWFTSFPVRHPKLTKVGKVTWSVTKVVAAGAVLAKAAYDIFGGKKAYHEIPFDADWREVTDEPEPAPELIEEKQPTALLKEALEALPEKEVEEIVEF